MKWRLAFSYRGSRKPNSPMRGRWMETPGVCSLSVGCEAKEIFQWVLVSMCLVRWSHNPILIQHCALFIQLIPVHAADIKPQSSLLSAIIKYGQDRGARLKTMTKEEQIYAFDHLDVDLMDAFHYVHPLGLGKWEVYLCSIDYLLVVFAELDSKPSFMTSDSSRSFLVGRTLATTHPVGLLPLVEVAWTVKMLHLYLVGRCLYIASLALPYICAVALRLLVGRVVIHNSRLQLRQRRQTVVDDKQTWRHVKIRIYFWNTSCHSPQPPANRFRPQHENGKTERTIRRRPTTTISLSILCP